MRAMRKDSVAHGPDRKKQRPCDTQGRNGSQSRTVEEEPVRCAGTVGSQSRAGQEGDRAIRRDGWLPEPRSRENHTVRRDGWLPEPSRPKGTVRGTGTGWHAVPGRTKSVRCAGTVLLTEPPRTNKGRIRY
jgi:hypothetical protein